MKRTNRMNIMQALLKTWKEHIQLRKNMFLLFIFFASCKMTPSRTLTRYYNKNVCNNKATYLGYNLKFILDTIFNKLDIKQDTNYIIISSNYMKKTIFADAFNKKDTFRFEYSNNDSNINKYYFIQSLKLIHASFNLKYYKISDKELKRNYVYNAYFLFDTLGLSDMTDNFSDEIIIKLWKNKKVMFKFYSMFGNELVNFSNFNHAYLDKTRSWRDASRAYRYGYNGKEKENETTNDDFPVISGISTRIKDGWLADGGM